MCPCLVWHWAFRPFLGQPAMVIMMDGYLIMIRTPAPTLTSPRRAAALCMRSDWCYVEPCIRGYFYDEFNYPRTPLLALRHADT